MPNVYHDELLDAERQGTAARDAMDAWLNRPSDAPGVSGAVLEGYARDLRGGRERIQRLIREHGTRDDLAAALERNAAHHRSVGLSIRDVPPPVDGAEESDE